MRSRNSIRRLIERTTFCIYEPFQILVRASYAGKKVNCIRAAISKSSTSKFLSSSIPRLNAPLPENISGELQGFSERKLEQAIGAVLPDEFWQAPKTSGSRARES